MVDRRPIHLTLAIESDGQHFQRLLRTPNGDQRLPLAAEAVAQLEQGLKQLEAQQASARLTRQTQGLRRALAEHGRRLFDLLNGPERWLEHGLEAAQRDDQPLHLVLQLLGVQKPHAWRLELLADSQGNLALRPDVQLLVQLGPQGSREPLVLGGGPLRVLFMAYSPEGVEPVLDFEAEEEALLRALEVEVGAGRVILEVIEEGSLGALEERLRSNRYDVVHLSGHGHLGPHGPELLMEDALGDLDRVGTERLFKALERGKSGPSGQALPSLVVLASCETAAGNSQTTSMAANLVERGVPAVIGWTRPVLDEDATVAAANLYQRLAAGSPLADALAFARRQLAELDHSRPMPGHGWGDLQLLSRTPGGLLFDIHGLREEDDAYEPPAATYGHLQYEEMTVLERGFVGRRRPLQRLLRVLRDGRDPQAQAAGANPSRPPLLGALLVGMKGVGKSCLAARALVRYRQARPDTRLLVLHGRINALQLYERLLALALAWRDSAAEATLKHTEEPLEQRFARLLRSLWSRRDLLIVLDDFEQNLTARPGDRHRLEAEAETLLSALLPALRGSRSKLLITSTALFALPAPLLNTLAEIELGAFGATEVHKLWIRDQSSAAGSASNNPSNSPNPPAPFDLSRLPLSQWQSLAQRLGHNPRVLDWARALIGQRPHPEVQALLRRASAELPDLRRQPHSPEEQTKLASLFLFHAAIDQARAQLPLDVEAFLQRARVYTAPVPARAFVPLLADLPTPPAASPLAPRPAPPPLAATPSAESLEPHLIHLANLGLLEFSSYQPQLPPERAFRLSPLVEPSLRAPHPETWHQHAARFYQSEAASSSGRSLPLTLQAWEHALAGRDAVIAGDCAGTLDHQLWFQGLYPLNLQLASRQQQTFPEDFRSCWWLAEALMHCGHLRQSRQRFVQAESLSQNLALAPARQSSFLHAYAALLRAQGDLTGARAKLERSLEIQQKLHGTDEHPGVAASLHELAGVLRAQGDLTGARAKLERSLEIKHRLNGSDEHPDIAASLHALAGVLRAQGDLTGARAKLERSLEIQHKLHGTDEHPGVAASLHELARVLQGQGDLTGSRAKLERSLEIKLKLHGTDEHPSVAASLHALAMLDLGEGDVGMAVEGLRQVLAIERVLYGTTEHPTTAETEWALGQILSKAAASRQEGLSLMLHALQVLSQKAPGHPILREGAESMQQSEPGQGGEQP